MQKIYKPTQGYDSFYQPYLDKVPNDGNLVEHLKNIQIKTEQIISPLAEETLTYSYSSGKWTIKDILVHLSDCERVLIYRAMRIARADKTNLPGFNESLFAANANANHREIGGIIKELSALRLSSIAFIGTLDDESLDRSGTANNYPMSARLLINHIYGHHRHHLDFIRERYLK